MDMARPAHSRRTRMARALRPLSGSKDSIAHSQPGDHYAFGSSKPPGGNREHGSRPRMCHSELPALGPARVRSVTATNHQPPTDHQPFRYTPRMITRREALKSGVAVGMAGLVGAVRPVRPSPRSRERR